MANQNLAKLLLKLNDPVSNQCKWIHLCYVPEIIHNEYKEKRPEDLSDMNSTLARWALEDFNKEMKITTAEELEELKNAVKEYSKEAYKDIYLEQSTDRQGWLRVWITKKMKEELSKNGE